MKRGFFLKLARSNISKNRRFFLPRILSEAGLLCVFYIVFTLRADERILQLRGGQYIEVFMSIGVAVMMLLSVILLFYINSFLMKQRKREFGVYTFWAWKSGTSAGCFSTKQPSAAWHPWCWGLPWGRCFTSSAPCLSASC